MVRSFLPVSVTAILLAACSPAAYKVNSPSVAVEDSTSARPEIVKEIPESQRDGYMRIVGDLRWDQFTSYRQWIKRFPRCLRVLYDNTHLWNEFKSEEGRWLFRYCTDFLVGGIPLSPTRVIFGSNSGTDSKTMTTSVSFHFFDDSQSRAVKAALAQKYNYTTDGHCSKYTC